MVYYLSMVRIIHKPSKYDMDNVRKHILQSNVTVSIFQVYECSENQLKHIHLCIRVDTIQDVIQLKTYVKTHRLKAYIDDIEDIREYKAYILYMCKTLTKDSKKYIDYNYSYSENEFIQYVKTSVENKIHPKINDDPFID